MRSTAYPFSRGSRFIAGFFLKSRNFLIAGMQKLCFFVSVVAVDQLLLEKLRRS